uniref:THO complex subunit 7 n=1 Tax=Terrapene triunguis TaxID=2587831 RepID=A0A674JDL8_9SAUR
MLSTLSQCEFSMGKTLLVYDMNLREMENYEKIYKDIENSIAAAHEKIAECKKQILQAKRIRKNRQEYDALAKVIQHHPDRHETLKQLEALGKELQHLSHIKENVEDKLELRRKQFHVLLSTIHELQQTLESKWFLNENIWGQILLCLLRSSSIIASETISMSKGSGMSFFQLAYTK